MITAVQTGTGATTGAAASRCSSSNAAWPASSAAATSTSSACTRRTPPSCRSPTSACPVDEPARRRGRGLRLPHREAAAGTHVDRGQRASPRPTPPSARRCSYVQDRKAFGKTIGSFQNTKFVLADIATEIDVAQAYVDRCVDRLNAGELSAADAVEGQVLRAPSCRAGSSTSCLQLHGGYGYMSEYPIARRYADARVTRIYGGTSEIMKTRHLQVDRALSGVRFVLASASPARLATLRARRASTPR